MRTLILVAGAALALAACKGNDQVANSDNADESLSAENMVSNDVTAIDAVTGEDANMAADVTYNAAPIDNEPLTATATTSNTAAPKPAKKTPKPASSAPANNGAANPTGATNNAE